VLNCIRDTDGLWPEHVSCFTSDGQRRTRLPAGRLIEVVGDSISAGYGNLGSEPHPNWVASPACHWTADNSTWYQTYAALAGPCPHPPAEVSTLPALMGMYRDASGNTLAYCRRLPNAKLEPTTMLCGVLCPRPPVGGHQHWGPKTGHFGDPGTPTRLPTRLSSPRSAVTIRCLVFLQYGSMVGEPVS